MQHTGAAASTSMEAPPADFFPGERLHDLVEMAIGEADPLFLDSQEDFFNACNESTYEESSEDSGDDDYIDEDNDCLLEQMLLPPEMLHNVQSLKPPKWHRHRGILQDNGDRSGCVDAEAGGLQSPCNGEEPLGEATIPAHLWSQVGVGSGSRGVDSAREGGPGMRSVQELGMRAGPGMGGEGKLFLRGGEGWAGNGWGGKPVSPPVSPPSIVRPTRQRTGGPVQALAERVQHPRRVPELSEEDYSSMSDDEGGAIGDMNGIPHLYRDETWDKRSFEYDPPRRVFTGCGGPTFEAHHRMPTFLMLFRFFGRIPCCGRFAPKQIDMLQQLMVKEMHQGGGDGGIFPLPV
jgi:hypothetical protein